MATTGRPSPVSLADRWKADMQQGQIFELIEEDDDNEDES